MSASETESVLCCCRSPATTRRSSCRSRLSSHQDACSFATYSKLTNDMKMFTWRYAPAGRAVLRTALLVFHVTTPKRARERPTGLARPPPTGREQGPQGGQFRLLRQQLESFLRATSKANSGSGKPGSESHQQGYMSRHQPLDRGVSGKSPGITDRPVETYAHKTPAQLVDIHNKPVAALPGRDL